MEILSWFFTLNYWLQRIDWFRTIIVLGIPVGSLISTLWVPLRRETAQLKVGVVDADPYSVHKGLFHAHLGWIVLRQDRSSMGQADMDDLSADPIVEWQRQHYAVLAITMAVTLPTTVAGLG